MLDCWELDGVVVMVVVVRRCEGWEEVVIYSYFPQTHQYYVTDSPDPQKRRR